MTTIGWTHITFPDGRTYRGESWNAVSGCDKVSPGCDNCYAELIASRFKDKQGHYYERGFQVTLRPERLTMPLHWKTPRGIFVNSMSDWCHSEIPDDYILDMFEVMLTANWHIYQLLTKRAPRMLHLMPRLLDLCERHTGTRQMPSHIWFGVSIESAAQVGRLSHLKQVPPETIRFVSYEPALGSLGAVDLSGIDWLIFGGESGKSASIRGIDPAWIDAMRERCAWSGTALYVKQMGTVWAKAHYSDSQALAFDFKGEDMDQWPEERRVRQYPDHSKVQTGHYPTTRVSVPSFRTTRDNTARREGQMAY